MISFCILYLPVLHDMSGTQCSLIFIVSHYSGENHTGISLDAQHQSLLESFGACCIYCALNQILVP